MMVMSYDKKNGSMSSEVIGSKSPSNAVERYDAFFQGVPLWGGKEWYSLSPDQIAEIFRQAAARIVENAQKVCQEEAEAFGKKSMLTKWRLKFRGFKLSVAPNLKEVLDVMAQRCRSLACWTEANQSRPFYADSDMSVFIRKPKQVADILTKS